MNYDLSTSQATLLGIVVVWDFVWKALALWRAGRNDQKGWFIVLLIINSVGILPIFYLLTHKQNKGSENA